MQQNFYLQSEEFNDYMRLINAKRHRIDFLFNAYLLKHGTQKDVARYGNLVVCIPNLFKCITEKSRHRCIHHTQINVREVKAQVYTPHSNKCQRSQGTGVYTTLKYMTEKSRHRCIHHFLFLNQLVHNLSISFCNCNPTFVSVGSGSSSGQCRTIRSTVAITSQHFHRCVGK